MYPIEYTWTKEDTIKTGKSIDTVKLSKWKPQNTFKDSESIQLKRLIETGILFIPTSKKAITANSVVIITKLVVISCAPVTPIFLPNKPDAIDPSKGSVIIVKYIIGIQFR